MGAILAAIAAIGRVILTFGRYLIPVLLRFWPYVLRLLALLFGSWTRILTWITVMFGFGGCDTVKYASGITKFTEVITEGRSFLFAKLAEPLPPWAIDLGGFVNMYVPLDTAMSAVGLIITVHLAAIAFGFAGRLFRMAQKTESG